ncbi:MAG: protein adenylyltransferase SelO family protein [Myxococcota bacterium]|nr:protein adenylyltransferase SelO family protein [Myxococcota bacterium]
MTRHAATASPLGSALEHLAEQADYSLLESLNADPDSTDSGEDHAPRQVFSGHYVPVAPTPIGDPEYVAHSPTLFAELGLADELARRDDFMRFFSGDLSAAPAPLRRHGWATGYALSIYGREYTQQCPFGTGNGYGDGRALSVLEGRFRGRRWEMQLKGAGRTPYCRGGDGRAVLRSSVREFLAQEHMHALGVPTSRSLSLYVSRSEKVRRPWYAESSSSVDPDRWVLEPVAISTRVAPSFLRVGQLELFARRARERAHAAAVEELELLLRHIVEREYRPEIPADLELAAQLVGLARAFRGRLISLVAHWIRVGYCQGNFNSDNTALGGFTLDYGPFGFMELFDPEYQPWTGGGWHFSFFNQPAAAQKNFETFCAALRTWPGFDEAQLGELDEIRRGFADAMAEELARMWASKLGLTSAEPGLVRRLFALMQQTGVDYTIFFRALSELPDTLEPLRASFYPAEVREGDPVDEAAWVAWLDDWRAAVRSEARERAEIIAGMKAVNPKLILREWQLVPAYQRAASGDYDGVRSLQRAMTQPYADQDSPFDALKPSSAFGTGGVSHMSCSS